MVQMLSKTVTICKSYRRRNEFTVIFLMDVTVSGLLLKKENTIWKLKFLYIHTYIKGTYIPQIILRS